MATTYAVAKALRRRTKMESKRKIELLFKRNADYFQQIDTLMDKIKKNKAKIVKLMAEPIETAELVTA
jgi:hypothetical protein